VPVTAHQGEQTTILGSSRVEIAPAGQKLLVDQTNDVDAVGHNARVRKLFGDQSPVDGSQIRQTTFTRCFPSRRLK
jgi:hypothetical protein